MAKNVLLTSLSAAEYDPQLRYYSIPNEFGAGYCDALLDTEAGIKAVLARSEIDEIVIIGGSGAYNGEDELKPALLTSGGVADPANKAPLSTYGLLRCRLAKYAEDKPFERNEEDGQLPAKGREQLKRFIQKYTEEEAGLKTKKLSRLFDELSQNSQLCDSFWTALFDACPELRDDQSLCRQWVRSYLYSELNPSAKPGLLTANEKTCIRMIPEDRIEEPEMWADSMVSMQKSIVEDDGDINLYVSLNSDDAADTFVVLNMLDILVSMPGSGVRLKKIFTIRSFPRQMAGVVRDDTAGFGVTELFHAISAFLNYGKADKIADIWKKSEEQNESIAGMVYAMRRVDVGLSMCNIPEVENGILRLRELFRGEQLWRDCGYYGVLFSVIAESVREDYGTLLEGDGDIPFIDMVKWAYRHQFYQQTLTLIESKAPEKIVSTGMFYYCNDEKNVDKVANLFAEKRLELRPFEYYKMDEIDHYFVKTYERGETRGMGEKGEDTQHVYASLRAQSVENKDPSKITGFTACDDKETLLDLLYSYYHIGDVRNKISHAISDKMGDNRLVAAESDDVPALTWMTDSIDFFIGSYEKALAQVQSKKPHIVNISSDYVRTAADRLKRESRGAERTRHEGRKDGRSEASSKGE